MNTEDVDLMAPTTDRAKPGTRWSVPTWVKDVPKIFPAMIAANKAIEAVGKDRKNEQQHYKFRGIDQVYDMIHGVLADAGIITVPVVLQRKASMQKSSGGKDMSLVEMEVEYWCYADDGSALVIGPVWGEALDMSDKSTNKAIAFAQKYALLQTFTIPTSDVSEGDRETLERGGQQSAKQHPQDRNQVGVQRIGDVMAAKVISGFGEVGVTAEQLRLKLGIDVTNAPFSMLDTLKGWRDQIAAKKTTAAAIFGASPSADRAAALNDKLKNGTPPPDSKPGSVLP